MSLYYSIFLVILGFIPSLIWLNFYFREDCHPEPKSLLTKVFLMGIIISPIAILLQLALVQCGDVAGLKKYCLPTGILLPNSPEFFLWSAFVEEMVKFFAVKLMVFNNPAFDEPIDAMIYMMTASLGFAAIENTLIVFQTVPDGLAITINTLILRFIGATLLHALSAGLLGYFLAVSWFFQHHRKKLLIAGMTIATLFHFTFNMIISTYEGQVTALLYTTSLLLMMAFLVSILFDRLKDKDIKMPAKN
jgi:RsiW-degrading membrane proteinase PrsW (M82 family)